MAGDWIQIDTDLRDKPEFLRLAELTGEADDVIAGRLVFFWSWVDSATSDGEFPGLTTFTLSRRFGGSPEFWDCLSDPSINWLSITDGGLTIPGFSQRFSNGAKRRIVDARRKASARRPQNVRNDADKTRTDCGAKEEKRREEKIKEEHPTDVCSESAKTPTSEPTEFDFPVVGKTAPASKLWNLPKAKLDQYVGAYPGLDVPGEMRRAVQWCIDNAARRKTPGGMPSFLTRWLNGAQDKPRPGPQQKTFGRASGAYGDSSDNDKTVGSF